jgi:glutathione S-transferase
LQVNNAWYWFVLAVAALWAKQTVVAFGQAIYRVRRGMVLSPEDRRFSGGQQIPDDSLLIRTYGIWRNDHETVPVFLAAAAAFAAIGGDDTTAAWLFGGFVAARYIHALVYLAALQPARALSWFACVVITGVIVVKSLIIALSMLK